MTSLEAWYDRFVGKTDYELTVEDLTAALRQNVQLERIVPLAIQRFHEEPAAGERYDGELFFALIGIDTSIWSIHQADLEQLFNYSLELKTDSVNERIEIESWQARVNAWRGART